MVRAPGVLSRRPSLGQAGTPPFPAALLTLGTSGFGYDRGEGAVTQRAHPVPEGLAVPAGPQLCSRGWADSPPLGPR